MSLLDLRICATCGNDVIGPHFKDCELLVEMEKDWNNLKPIQRYAHYERSRRKFIPCPYKRVESG